MAYRLIEAEITQLNGDFSLNRKLIGAYKSHLQINEPCYREIAGPFANNKLIKQEKY